MAVGTVSVDQSVVELEHPLKTEIERLREIILDADTGITEQIKWNAPSFCHRGDDRVTMKLYPAGQIQLIFHRGARPKDAADFAFEDNSGLLNWAANDRGVATFRNVAEIEMNEAVLQDLVNRWIIATSE